MPETLYKLTTQDWKTRVGHGNETLWGPGVSHTASGIGTLCSEAFLHAYTNPLLAVFMNPVHAGIENPVLWRCTGEVVVNDSGLKVGCKSLTTLKIMRIPRVTMVQRVAFAILCATALDTDRTFTNWAQLWLSGEDRTSGSAEQIGCQWWKLSTKKSQLASIGAGKAAFLLATNWGAMQVARVSATAAVDAAECTYGGAPVDFIGLAQRAAEVK